MVAEAKRILMSPRPSVRLCQVLLPLVWLAALLLGKSSANRM